MKNAARLVPAQCVRQRVSFLFQAELSIDRCKDLQQLRAYYACLWPENSVEEFLTMWSDGNAWRKCSVSIPGMSCILTFLQWFVFKKVCLTLAQIEESESSIRAFLVLLRGADTPTKELMISMRMRLNKAAMSLCCGLPLSYLQSLRKIEHLNAAPHLSLRLFSAESCGVRSRTQGKDEDGASRGE